MAVAGSIIAASALIGVTSSSAAAGGSDVITTVAGGGGTPGIGSGVASLSASLGSPLSGVFDAHGNVVFADQNNNVIRVAAASTGTFWGHAMTAGHTYTIVGNGTDGDLGDGSSNPLTSAELSGPNGVAIDSTGDLAITDSGNDAVRFVAAAGGFRYGQQMTAGKIYTIAGGGQEGEITPGVSTSRPDSPHPTASPSTPRATSSWPTPATTSSDSSPPARVVFGMRCNPGHLHPRREHELRVHRQWWSRTFGPAPTGFLQRRGHRLQGRRRLLRRRQRGRPHGGGGHRHRLGRAVKAGYIYTIAGSGPNDEGFKGNKKPATKAWLDTPQGVAVDSAGNVFISDSLNNMIRARSRFEGQLRRLRGQGE